jgi:hypothetical protein
MSASHRDAVKDVCKAAQSLDEWAPNYDRLLEQIGDARF